MVWTLSQLRGAKGPLTVLLGLVVSASAEPLLTPGDYSIAIDRDSVGSYPTAEGPWNVSDGSISKYTNRGAANSGFIITPSAGRSVLTAFRITTANDHPERDPAAWALHGTNDAIVSTDNSSGDAENWTLIATGTINLPTDRDTPGTMLDVPNTAAFASYRMVFTALRDMSSAYMAIGEVEFLGTLEVPRPQSILAPGDFIIAIDRDSTSLYSAAQAPAYAINRTLAKHLNRGGINSGLIVTPAFGRSIVTSLRLTTANDHSPRDPTNWTLYGTNDAIASLDNGTGEGENWTLIDSGTTGLPLDRNRLGPVVPVAGLAAYTSYRIVFTSLRDTTGTAYMQIGEIQLYGTDTMVLCPNPFADGDGDGDVDQVDFALLQACYTGQGGTKAEPCRCWDRDGDKDIDAQDMNAFIACALTSGPAIPPASNCGG